MTVPPSQMKVVFDLTAGVQQRAGMGRYANQLARGLAERPDEVDLRLFYASREGRPPQPPLDALARRVLKWPAKPWRMRVLATSLLGGTLDGVVGEGDIFHATDHLLPPSRMMRSVLTVHDLAFLDYPDTHLPLNRWFLRLMMPRFVRRADAVICVSRTTKADVLRHYEVPESKLHVIYEGVEPQFRPSQDTADIAKLRSRLGLNDPFILSVGTLEPRKNLVTLLRSYERLVAESNCSHVLAIVGHRGWKSEEFLSALDRSPVRSRVLLLGRVAEADLPLCYAAADLFVYPSWYEGFGLPPLEAMACGAPTLVSNAGALPEVAGHGALIFSPADIEQLASLMGRVLRDTDLRTMLRDKGMRWAKQFAWHRAAEQTIAVYHHVLGGKKLV